MPRIISGSKSVVGSRPALEAGDKITASSNLASPTSFMSETDAAWLAGFFDGEGSIFVYKGGRGGKYDCYAISLPNTNFDSIEHCFNITGVGLISKKTKRIDHHKQQFQWRVNVQKDILRVLKRLAPYLVVKKQKALDMINILEKKV